MPKIKTNKDEILKKCIPIIQKQGYRNSSMADLAKACEVRTSHFYYYFEDKQDLMLEILRNLHIYFRKKVVIWAYQETLTAKEKTEKFTDACEGFFLRKGGAVLGYTISEISASEIEFQKILQVFFSDFTDAWIHIFQENFSSEKAFEKAEQTVQDIQGGLLLTRVYKNSKYLKNALKRVSGQFITDNQL